MKQAMSDTWEAMSKYSVDKCKKNLDKVFAVEMKKDPHFCDFDEYYYFGTALNGLYFAKIPDARVHHTFVRFECVPLRIANQVAQWGHPTRTARQHAKLGVPRRVPAPELAQNVGRRVVLEVVSYAPKVDRLWHGFGVEASVQDYMRTVHYEAICDAVSAPKQVVQEDNLEEIVLFGTLQKPRAVAGTVVQTTPDATVAAVEVVGCKQRSHRRVKRDKRRVAPSEHLGSRDTVRRGKPAKGVEPSPVRVHQELGGRSHVESVARTSTGIGRRQS